MHHNSSFTSRVPSREDGALFATRVPSREDGALFASLKRAKDGEFLVKLFSKRLCSRGLVFGQAFFEKGCGQADLYIKHRIFYKMAEDHEEEIIIKMRVI